MLQPFSFVFLYFIQNWGYVNSFCSLCVCFKSAQVYPGIFLMYIISAAVVILAPLALMVQFSLPYNRAGRTSVLYGFILFFSKVFCRLHVLLMLPGIFKWLLSLLSMSTSFP